MKTWSIARCIAVTVAVIALTGAGAEAATAATPVGPQQHFVGFVNGKRHHVVVHTVCPGPATRHRFGRVEKGQTMAVAQVMNGHGDTGPFSRIFSWFQPARKGTRPVMLKFRRYGQRKGIPGSVRVPCGGKGRAVFSSCPYLAPCAVGFIPDTVKVTFENIAASRSRGGARQRR